MRRGVSVLLCILLCAAADLAAAQTEQIDPRILGAWARSVQGSTGQKQKHVWELRADGSYVSHEGAGGHLGRFTAWDGSWTRTPSGGGGRPEARQRSDHGRYVLQKDGALKVTGLTGTHVWRRIEPAQELLPTRDIKIGRLPVKLPQLLARTWIEQARPWHKDAVPIEIKIKRNVSTRSFEVAMRFLSPSDSTSFVVEVGRFRRSQSTTPPGSWKHVALPGLFRDLPDALEEAFYKTGSAAGLASQAARPTRLESAELNVWDEDQPLWTLFFVRQSRGITVGAFGSAIRDDLPLEFTKDFSLQWKEAAAGLTLLFAAPDKDSDGVVDGRAFHCTMIGGVWNPDHAPGCHVGPDKHRY